VIREIVPHVPFCDAKALPIVVELADKLAVSAYQPGFSEALQQTLHAAMPSQR